MAVKIWAGHHSFKTYDYTPWWIYPASAAFIAFGVWEIKTWQKEKDKEKDKDKDKDNAEVSVS